MTSPVGIQGEISLGRNAFDIDSASQKEYDRLFRWFTKNGGFLHPDICIGQGQHGIGLFMRSSEYVNANRVNLVACPSSCSFSILNMNTIAPWWPEDFSREFVDSVEVLTRLLLIEAWLAGDKSFWFPYIQTLPQPGSMAFDTPMYWPDSVLSIVAGTDIAAAVGDRKAKWMEELEKCRRTLERLSPDHAEHVRTHYTWERYLWAATVLTSRCFPNFQLQDNFMYGLPLDPDIVDSCPWLKATRNRKLCTAPQPVPTLLPVYDLANHNPLQGVSWYMEGNLIRLDHVSRHHEVIGIMQEGQEIYNNYGQKQNEELIMGYGFALANGGVCPGLKKGLTSRSYSDLCMRYRALSQAMGTLAGQTKGQDATLTIMLYRVYRLRVERGRMQDSCRQLIELKYIAQASTYAQIELLQQPQRRDTFTVCSIVLEEVKRNNDQIKVLQAALAQHKYPEQSDDRYDQCAELAKSYNLDVCATLAAISQELAWGRELSERYHERCWRYDNMLEDSPPLLAIPFRQLCRSEFGSRHVGRDQPFPFELEPFALMTWLALLLSVTLDPAFNAEYYDEELLDEIDYLQERYCFPSVWPHDPECSNLVCFQRFEATIKDFIPAAIAETVSAESRSKAEELLHNCWVREDTLAHHKHVTQLLRSSEYMSRFDDGQICTLAFWATAIGEMEGIWGNVDEFNWDIYASGAAYEDPSPHWFIPAKFPCAKEPKLSLLEQNGTRDNSVHD